MTTETRNYAIRHSNGETIARFSVKVPANAGKVPHAAIIIAERRIAAKAGSRTTRNAFLYLEEVKELVCFETNDRGLMEVKELVCFETNAEGLMTARTNT